MTRLEQLDRETYYAALTGSPDARFHQLWDHEAARTDGCRFEAVRTSTGAVALVRVKTVPILGRGLAYVYGGPAFPDVAPAREEIERTFADLRDEYTDRRLLLRVVPPLRPDRDVDVRAALDACGYRPVVGVAGYRTILLPLSEDLETLKAGFKKRLRYGVNRSLRNCFAVDSGTDVQLYDRFLELYDEMWERKQFDTGVDPRWIRTVQERLPAEHRLVIRIARLGSEDMAATVHAHVGDTVLYLLGATRVEEDASPDRLYSAHRLHWDVICTAVGAGARAYDLGGIDPEKNPGGYTFKEAFGGVDVRSLGAWEVGSNLGSRFVVGVGERLRNRRRGASGRSEP